MLFRSSLVQRAKEIEAEAERRLTDASKRYGPDHPRMVAAQADLKAAQENLKRQVATAAQGVAKDYELARANEAAVERALARSKGDIQAINRKEFELQALERDELSRGGRPAVSATAGEPQQQLGLFRAAAVLEDDPVRARLSALDIDRLTPLEALTVLADLRKAALG